MRHKRFIDLSITIESGLPSDPPLTIPKIDYVDHNRGREQMKDFFWGLPVMICLAAWAGLWSFWP